MVDIIDSVQLETVPGGIVDLFELELDGVDLFFYAGLAGGTDAVWFPDRTGTTNNKYIAIPIDLTGIDVNSDGAASRPTLTVANIIGAITASDMDTTIQEVVFDKVVELSSSEFTNEMFIGTRLTRRRTLTDFLLTVSDPAPGSPPEEFPVALYIIDRIASENNVMVSFELTSPLDVEGVKIPNRIVIGKYCSWQYQGYFAPASRGGCPMTRASTRILPNRVGTGTHTHYVFFDVDDNPCADVGNGATAWSAGTYNKDDLRTNSLMTWRCNLDGVTSEPAIGNLDWQALVIYDDWNPGIPYSYVAPTNYTAVKVNHRLWQPKRDVPAGESPPTNAVNTSFYWKRVDVCGKTVRSCKLRFQYLPISLATGWKTSIASVDVNTSNALPFGGFPGTTKFK